MTVTPAARTAELLSRMTIEEKAQQLTSVMPFGLLNVDVPSWAQLDKELSLGIGQVSMLSMFSHLPPIDLAGEVQAETA